MYRGVTLDFVINIRFEAFNETKFYSNFSFKS